MSVMSALPHPLWSAAIARPHQAFVNDLSYAELAERVARRASQLEAQRPAWRGARLGLSGRYDELWVEWAMSLSWLGATVAPMGVNATAQERAQRRERLSLEAVISLDERGVARDEEGAELVGAGEESEGRAAAQLEPAPWAWERAQFALMTSGTTGAPKPIELSARALTMSALGSMVRLGHLPSDRWLACLPLHHVGGLSILTRALLQQTSLRFVAPKGEALAEALCSGQYQLCSLTPTLLSDALDHLERLSDERRAGLESLRVLLIGGARTSAELWERARALGLPLRLTWGMSEAASQVCTQVEQAPPGGALPPLPFQRVELSDEGCLVVSGPTTERGRFETRDLGHIDERGWVSVQGRLDELIISGGINVHPREIEERLSAHPSLADAAVLGVDDPRWGQALHAYLRLKEGAERPSDEELKGWCRAQLSHYKTPKIFHWRDALPRDPLGKLQRHRLNPSHGSEGSS